MCREDNRARNSKDSEQRTSIKDQRSANKDTDMEERVRVEVRKLFGFIGLGEYPRGYDPAVHGPYMPSRYYGKRIDLCFLC